MNAFKVTYTDGTSYTTSANGTLEEFTAYLMQFGGIVTKENPATGKEIRLQIAKIEIDSSPLMVEGEGAPQYMLPTIEPAKDTQLALL